MPYKNNKYLSALFFIISFRFFRGARLHSLLLIIGFFSSSAWGYSYRVIVQEQGEYSAAQASPGDELQYPAPIIWKKRPLSFSLDLNGSTAPVNASTSNSEDWNATAEISINKWMAAEEKLSWVEQGQSSIVCNDLNTQDHVNLVTWSDDSCAGAWGDGILAVTQINYQFSESGGDIQAEIIEAHILLNNTLRWDAYDGDLKFDIVGRETFDVKRVLLHEFGHALGLTHPDENGQQVSAIMNSLESDLYTLASDDIAGVRALYSSGASGTVPVVTEKTQSSRKGSIAMELLCLLAALLFFRNKKNKPSSDCVIFSEK